MYVTEQAPCTQTILHLPWVDPAWTSDGCELSACSRHTPYQGLRNPSYHASCPDSSPSRRLLLTLHAVLRTLVQAIWRPFKSYSCLYPLVKVMPDTQHILNSRIYQNMSHCQSSGIKSQRNMLFHSASSNRAVFPCQLSSVYGILSTGSALCQTLAVVILEKDVRISVIFSILASPSFLLISCSLTYTLGHLWLCVGYH